MNKLINQARNIPVAAPTPTLSVAPVVLSAPGRAVELEVRVTAPVTDDNPPIILLSHGHGPSLYIPSMNGYGPLVEFWAARGFVVIQPTHLNAKLYALGPDTSARRCSGALARKTCRASSTSSTSSRQQSRNCKAAWIAAGSPLSATRWEDTQPACCLGHD